MSQTKRPTMNWQGLMATIILIAGLLPWAGGVQARPPHQSPTPTRAPFAYGVSFLSPAGQVGTTYQGAPQDGGIQVTADPAELAAQALSQINDARQAASLPPLLLSDALTEAAAAHADDLLTHSFFEHQGSDGSWPAGRAIAHGHPASCLAENMAVGQATAQETVDAWLADDGSRANLLDARFSHAGLAFAHNGPWHNYWVLLLGDPPAYRPGRVLVKFQPAITTLGAQETLARLNAASLGRIGGLNVERLAVPVGQETAIVAALQQNPDVVYAELDRRVQAVGEPDDPYYSGKWWWEQIQAPAAWDVSTGSEDVIIAIIDTGVDLDHPDLAAKIVSGYDFVNGDDDPDDDEGHGTHVAGIAAAVTNNGLGVAGLSWGARIMPLKVLNANGSGYASDVAAAIYHAADNGAQIINMSLGSSSPSGTISDATDYAHDQGVFIAAAAGNDGTNSLLYPAANEHVVGVGATNSSDSRAYFSNYASHVDVAAPGMSIYSTTPGDYGYKSGTSMATPFVAGLAALVLSLDSNLSPDEVESIIEDSADDLGDPGRDDYYGWGRINAHQALITTVPQTMSGAVQSLEGHGVAGVLLTIAGSQTFSTTTDSDGSFSQTGLPWGTYIVTPDLADLTFSPPTRTVVITTSDVSGVAFSAQISETFEISGVIHAGGEPCAGIEVVIADEGLGASSGHRLHLTTLTDSQGRFTLSGIISDTYTLTPVATGHTFDPATTTVEVGSESLLPQNFVMSSFIISGTVRDQESEGLSGVLISLSEIGQTTTPTTTTDAGGIYTFTEVISGTYVLTPSLGSATFDPPTRTVIITNGDQGSLDFTRNNFYVYLPLVFRNFSTAVFPDDPYFDDQWGLHNASNDADIDAPEAWGISTGDSNVIVAILDTGVDMDHPEFSGRFTADRWDFVNNDNNPDDDHGHGTHVAGIAAATGNNGSGVAGVAWDVKIMPVKVMDSEGSGSYYDMIAGINYAVTHNAQVINMSLGGYSYSKPMQDAIDEAYAQGVLVVAAMGNHSVDDPMYPAACSHVMAVASTTNSDARSSFSNYGAHVDIAAPGSSIYSTYMGGGYGYMSGTSMATPFVAGLAGLIYSHYPGYTPDQVAQAIAHNADDLGSAGHDDYFGCGRINAYRALSNGAVSSGCSGWGGLSLTEVKPSAPPAGAEFRAGVLLLKFQDVTSQAERENILAAHGLAVLNTIEGLDIHLVSVPEGQELALAETLNADPSISYAEPDYKVYAQ